MFKRGLFGAVFWLFMMTAALAHSWYPAYCCDDRDCGPVDESLVTQTKDGYIVDGTFYSNKMVMASHDGQYHACRLPGSHVPLCFFVPLAS